MLLRWTFMKAETPRLWEGCECVIRVQIRLDTCQAVLHHSLPRRPQERILYRLLALHAVLARRRSPLPISRCTSRRRPLPEALCPAGRPLAASLKLSPARPRARHCPLHRTYREDMKPYVHINILLSSKLLADLCQSAVKLSSGPAHHPRLACAGCGKCGLLRRAQNTSEQGALLLGIIVVNDAAMQFLDFLLAVSLAQLVCFDTCKGSPADPVCRGLIYVLAF